MTETAPPQEKPVRRSALGHVTDQVVDLAVLNVVWGGGLVLGVLALILLRELPSISYAQRVTTFWAAFWIGAVASGLAGIGFAVRGVRGWSTFLRRFVAADGAAGFALLVFQIGLFGGWDLLTLEALLCIGAPLLIAGLAIWRARRWGGYLELVIALAASGGCWYKALRPSADGLPSSDWIFFALVLLLILFAFLEGLSAFLFAERRVFILRFAPFRVLLRLAFAAFVMSTVLVWIVSTLVSPDSRQQSRQKRTMADMRSMITAVETYAETNKIFPATQDVAELARVLEPSYIPVLPRNDGWGKPLEYYRVTLPSGVQGFVIRSAGADGVFEQKDPTAYTYGGVEGGPERDIVFSTVSTGQWPEGMMGP